MLEQFKAVDRFTLYYLQWHMPPSMRQY